ncbi:MAG: hypothetical protein ACRD2L_06030, partial [Terriglobia bacterium]
VEAYEYRHYDDGGPGVLFMTPISCPLNTSFFACIVDIPAYTPGLHTVFITAANAAGESGPSNTLSFNMVVTPATPTNFRLAFYVDEFGKIVWGIRV